MKLRELAVLLAWTLTVTGATYDALNKEWVIAWDVAEENQARESGTTRVPALMPAVEAEQLLQQAFDEARGRRVPPVAPGTVIKRR